MQNPFRRESGMSLPTVMALGVVASLWMLGTASLVVPAANRVTVERTMDMVRCSAEAGLDYALQKINNSSTRTAMLAASSWTIPNDIMADYDASKTPATKMSGTITISNVRPPTTATKGYVSYLYDQTSDDQQASSIFNGTGNMWRVLTAQVSCGGVSRAVRVILKPVVDSTTTTTNGAPQPIFRFTAFGQASVDVQNGNVNSYNSNASGFNPNNITYQDITSYTGTPANSATAPVPGYGDVASNGGITIGSNGFVGGNVESWGNSPTTNTVSNGGTVKGVIDGVTISGSANQGTSTTTTTTTQQIPTMKAEPATFNNSNLSGNPQSINLSGNDQLVLPAGNYKFNSISVTGNGKLIIDNTNGPVNIWVGGTNSSITLAGKGNINTTGKAENLQIWYEGNQEVKVAGNGDITGVVWAANAPVTVNGNGFFRGAVLANTINFRGNNSTFAFDRALLASSTLQWTPTVTTTVEALQNFQAVSWHEFNPNSPF